MASLRDIVINALGGPQRAAEIWAAAKQEPGRVAQGIGSAVTLPGDVYSGRAPVTDPSTGMPTSEVMDRAAGLAGMASMGGVGFEGAGPNAVLRGTRAPVNESVAGGFNKNYRMLLDGRDVGGLSLNTENPRNLWVNYVGSPDGAANTIGPKGMRSILQEIQRTYPDAESIGGYRFSGARARSAATADASVPLPGIDAVPGRAPQAMSLRDLAMQGATANMAARPLIDPATGAPQGWPVY